MARAVESPNLLDLRPRRLVQHRLDGTLAVVLVPRFRARWMGWLQRRLKNPHIKLHLDELGTAVWIRCDGQRTVGQIGEQLRAEFGEKIEPVWDRLALFLRRMRQGRLIELGD